MSDAIVCGFWDAESGLAGIAWALAGASGCVLRRPDETPEVAAAAIAGDDEPAVRIEAGGETVEAKLKPRSKPSPLPGFEAEAALVRAAVKGGAVRKAKCEGYVIRWAADPTEAAGLLRHLALPAAEDSVLIAISSAEPGAPDHSAEACSAWLLDPEGGSAAYPEALVSTQYDAAGLQTRVGVELWSGEDDAPPMRGAGTVAGGATALDGVSAALLDSSVEGHRGAGGYLIWRRQA